VVSALTSRDASQLRRALLGWYDAHRRDLPWRCDSDPYRVWVSEIMLQQTRVAAVVDHYARFMQRFPAVEALASASEASVLAIWSGLGYYHRARRMHQAAKIIVRERRGQFPRTAEAWRQLPGVGRYTAAAIASIAFGEAVPVVDGNVERVLERLFQEGKKRESAWLRAEAVLDCIRPGDFNQAMMELGATICTPRAPQCLICPLYKWCCSRGAAVLKPRPARKQQHLHYALPIRGKSVRLIQRPRDARRMAGMWELPQAPVHPGEETLGHFRHSITDTDYDVSVVSAPPALVNNLEGDARWFTRQQWQKLPLTGLTRKILRKLAPAT
jgi:A/G-specific adenine glycosylase